MNCLVVPRSSLYALYLVYQKEGVGFYRPYAGKGEGTYTLEES